MDHLPLCDEGLRKLGSVEYFNEVPYDNGGYWGFPQRQGWADEELELGLIKGSALMMTRTPVKRRSPDDHFQDPSIYASLLQSWWYIGMLHEVLQRPVMIDVLFRENDATPRVLKTTELKSLLKTLERDLRELDPDSARERISSMARCIGYTHDCLQRVAKRVDDYRSDSVRLGFIREVTPSHDSRLFERFYWTRYGRKIIPHQLEVAICSLGYTLEYAVRNLWINLGLGKPGDSGCPPLPRWYIPTSLRLRIKEQGFCRLDYERYKPTLGFLGVCMASTYDRRWESNAHLQCTKDRCSGDNINYDAYEQRHVRDDCRCCMTLPPQVYEEILAIIERYGIPAVRVAAVSEDPDSELEFQVLEIDPAQEYVAISHVWANGRGNTKGNGMYRCQWLHLQSLASKCRKVTGSRPLSRLEDLPPFWIDTVCVPSGRGVPRIALLRMRAIFNMQQIYRQASDVLVLDSQLENRCVTSAEDLCMRVTLSSWMRRLWTMHEGAVAKSVMVQTAMGAISLGGLQSVTMEIVTRTGQDLPGGVLHGMGFVEAVTMWSRCLNVEADKETDTNQFLFFFSWQEARRRSTSVPMDRYLVMGIINNLDRAALLELQRSEEDTQDMEASARRKLKMLLLKVPSIPQSIIFTPKSPRGQFTDTGLGWMPANMESRMDPPLEIEPPGRRTVDGLHVEYKGWHLLSTPDWTHLFLRDIQYVHPLNQAGQPRRDSNSTWPPNLTWDMATLLEETGQSVEDAKCAFVVSAIDNELSNSVSNLYNVTIIALPTWKDNANRTHTSLAMILQQPLSTMDRHTDKMPRRAILVEETSEKDGVIYTRFLCQALWWPIAEQDINTARDAIENGQAQEVQAIWCNHGSTQRWCVG